jgi:hypothetical protein
MLNKESEAKKAKCSGAYFAFYLDKCNEQIKHKDLLTTAITVINSTLLIQYYTSAPNFKLNGLTLFYFSINI